MDDPLQGTAQANSVYYRDFFSDTAKDPFNGDYAQALLPYAVPATNAVPAADVRALAVNCRTQNVPTAFLLLHNDDQKLHIYLQLEKFHTRLGLPATPYDDRLFIGKGELHHNSHLLVEWNAAYFAQTNNIRVPSVDLVDNAYAADVAANILGPYGANDVDTEVLRIRSTCFVPPAYVPLFLAKPLTPREAWDIIKSQIYTDQRQVACTPLLDYLRCALTRTQLGLPPVLAIDPPTVPMAPPLLLDRRRAIIETDFPILNVNLAQIQQNQIAGQLGLLVTETRASREAETSRRAVEKNKTASQFLGAVGALRLMRYTNVHNADGFSHFWTQIAQAPKSQHLSILQWEVNRIKTMVNEPDLTFIVTASQLEVIKSLQYEMSSNDSVDSGFNNFIFGDQNIDEALSQQAIYEMLHGDGAAPSLSDAAALLKAKAGAPKMIFNARQQVRRYEIATKILLGTNHDLGVALNAYCNRMVSSEGLLHRLQSDHLLLPTMLCKKIAVQASNWFKYQSASATPIPVPNFCRVFDDIEEENPWIPTLSPTFLQKLGLSSFNTPRPPLRAPPIAPVRPPADPTREEQRTNNLEFNAALFQIYKDSPMSCRIIRTKIRANELPNLPASKVDNLPVCLAWHCKSMCNANCGRRPDHVSYTPDEYAPLVQWCASHFDTA